MNSIEEVDQELLHLEDDPDKQMTYQNPPNLQ